MGSAGFMSSAASRRLQESEPLFLRTELTGQADGVQMQTTYRPREAFNLTSLKLETTRYGLNALSQETQILNKLPSKP